MGQGSEKDEGDGWMARTPSTRAEPNPRARRRPNPFSGSTTKLRHEECTDHGCYWLRSTSRRIIQDLETTKAHPNGRDGQSRLNIGLDSRTHSTQLKKSNVTERYNDNRCLNKKLVDLRNYRPRVLGEPVTPSKRKLCMYMDMKMEFEPIQQPAAKSCKRSLNFNVEKVEVEDQIARFNENRGGCDLKSLKVYEWRRQKVTSCSNFQSVMSRKDGSRDMRPEELIDSSVQRAEYPELSNGRAQLRVNKNTPNTKDHLKAKLELDGEKMRGWKLEMDKDDYEASQEENRHREIWLQQERKLLRTRVESFIAKMQRVQGDRAYLPWKGSVVDSVVGAFLTQNVNDTSSSSAFMSLAAKYPHRIVDENKPAQKNFASSTSKAMKGTQASSAVKLDCVEWNEVRSARVKEISDAISVRGMKQKTC